MAVRFHLPSKVYGHRRAADGVERGNILGWRQETALALDGGRLEFGAEMDERSILSSTVMLFAGAVVLAAVLLAVALWAVVRRGGRSPALALMPDPREGAGRLEPIFGSVLHPLRVPQGPEGSRSRSPGAPRLPAVAPLEQGSSG
jgi:hypothetical protein